MYIIHQVASTITDYRQKKLHSYQQKHEHLVQQDSTLDTKKASKQKIQFDCVTAFLNH